MMMITVLRPITVNTLWQRPVVLSPPTARVIDCLLSRIATFPSAEIYSVSMQRSPIEN